MKFIGQTEKHQKLDILKHNQVEKYKKNILSHNETNFIKMKDEDILKSIRIYRIDYWNK